MAHSEKIIKHMQQSYPNKTKAQVIKMLDQMKKPSNRSPASYCDYCSKKMTGKSYSQIGINKCRSCDKKGY